MAKNTTLSDLNAQRHQQKLVNKLLRNHRSPDRYLYGADNRFIGQIDVQEVLQKSSKRHLLDF